MTVRHVRTGEHRGTITRIVRGEAKEFPRAVTACGAEQTGADLSRVGAVSAIVDSSPELGEMCPTCRARVEAVTGAKPGKLSGRITGPQQSYLRRLLDEAFSRGYSGDVSLDRHHLERTGARYASFAIEHLKAAKERGWTEVAL